MLILSNAFWCGGYYNNFDDISISDDPGTNDSGQKVSDPPKNIEQNQKLEIWVDITPWGESMKDFIKRAVEYESGPAIPPSPAEITRTVATYDGGKGSNPDWLGVSKGLLTFGLSRSRTIPTIPLTILFNVKPFIDPGSMPQ